MSTHTCEHCNKSFKPGPGAKGRFCSKPCQHKGVAVINKQNGEARRMAKPVKLCAQCHNDITSTYGKLYCSKSCSAIANNSNKTLSIDHKANISKGLKGQIPWNKGLITSNKSLAKKVKSLNPHESPIKSPKAEGPFSRVYCNVCAKSGLIFYSMRYQKYHPSVITDRKHYVYACRFKFSISQFPLWFDGDLINKHGWYSTPGSRKGVRNLNGVSRDHLVSIDYGFRNNISPAIISHPANCSLVQHKDNQRKRTSCAMSVEELMLKIAQFDALYMDWQDR